MKIDSDSLDIQDWASKSSEEIQEEIDRLEIIKMQRTNEEQSIKLLINSVYGAYGSKYFIMYNTDIAEAITLQGQDIIKNANKYIDLYFREFWYKDFAVHQTLGIEQEVSRINESASFYNDTDSSYVTFEPVMKSCGWKGDPKQFILSLYEIRLKDFLNNCFDKYGEKFNTKNLQNFEMEMISESGIFIAKKKYVLNPVWKDPGIDIPSLSKIKPKGVEIVQGSTPPFIRTKMKDLMRYIFIHKKEINYADFVKILKDIKSEFKIQPVERISITKGISDYEKYIANDRDHSRPFEVRSKCPIHVRAAGYYNYTLGQNKKWKSKYQMIKSGDKVKYYYAEGEDEVFAYHTDSFPYEFSPKVNFDIQFEKTLISPINRFMEVIGLPPIPGNLVTTKKLF
jgi:DNA polymerase elongation subunit (family B)